MKYYQIRIQYVISMTSGTYDDFRRGALFCVPDKEQATIIVDELNKLAAFNNGFSEDLQEWYNNKWDEIYNQYQNDNDEKKFSILCECLLDERDQRSEKEYSVPTDLVLVHEMLSKHIDTNIRFWPEEVAFEWQELSVYQLEKI